MTTSSERTGDLERSTLLGRKIRGGPAEGLGRPTSELIREALAAGDAALADEYLTYYAGECQRIVSLYSVWLRDLLAYGEEHSQRYGARASDLQATIGHPPPILAAESPRFAEAVATARRAIASKSAAELDAALFEVSEAHLSVHDVQADWCWGLLTILSELLGEDAMDDVFRETQGRWVRERYATLGEMSSAELLQLTVEGMRGHHGGKSRDGSVAIHEDETKWVLSFDPCGSGGRMRRTDAERRQTPRDEPPFNFARTKRPHDWSWGREGVCLYCAHCAVVNEIIPIEEFGAPMRVTDYPEHPGEPCRWTIYKDRHAAPDDAYRRVGKSRQ